MNRMLTVIPIVAVALAACTASGGAGTPATEPPPATDRPSAAPTDVAGTLRLDASANGTTVTVAPGTAIVIALDANPTTGYSWIVTSVPDPASVALDSPPEGAYVATPVGSAVVGSGGVQTWDLRATGAGTTSIQLDYARPWESGTPPVETFSVTFVVA
ncbi:MAG: protease inhibitor I42 family protein [Chloroflexi bacterium]|nr:protease inhibitor I42 family protein [Chloroflexota bacterium]